MKTIKTDGICYLNSLRPDGTWYWGTDCSGGDLYEAEESYRGGYAITPNRIIFVRYPDGKVIEPIKATEGQYFGQPVIVGKDSVYLLRVDFRIGEIHILRFELEHVTECRADVIVKLPLSSVEDCYNLMLQTEPLMLIRQSADNYFQIVWSETDGESSVGFEIGERESFSHMRDNKLYFQAWREEEEPEYAYYEEVIVRDRNGEIIGHENGGLFEIRSGEYWVLE